jgi:hypothetical protein
MTIKMKKVIRFKAVVTSPLFMGQGEVSMGRAYAKLLVHQECYNRLSSMQQPDASKESKEYRRKAERANLADALAIFESITGYQLRMVREDH